MRVWRKERRGEPEPRDLSPAGERVLETLRADGIAITSFADLIGDEALWSELASDMEGFVERARARVPDLSRPTSKEDFLIRRYRDVEQPRIDSRSPWLRYPLETAILDVVDAYRGQGTRLVDIDHWYTVPYPQANERVASQRWHRDPEDQHVVKVFLYLSDVDEGAGPFQYVPGSAQGGRYGDLWSWGEHDWYPPQDAFEAAIPEADRRTYTGPAGTIVMCDTSGFHRGGFAQSSPRVLAYHTFVSSGAPQKRTFEVAGSPRKTGLSEAAARALS
jgi:hypothetical protein